MARMTSFLRIPMVDARAYDIARHLQTQSRRAHAARIQINPHIYCFHERGICLPKCNEPLNVKPRNVWA
jgi:hypothetical protein